MLTLYRVFVSSAVVRLMIPVLGEAGRASIVATISWFNTLGCVVR